MAVEMDPSRQQLSGPIWRRRVECHMTGQRYTGSEWFFLLHWKAADARAGGTPHTPVIRESTHEYRWWTREQRQHTTETVSPEQLFEFLEPLLSSGWDGQLRSIR